MRADFPEELDFYELAVTHVRGLMPRVRVFAEQPADEESRGGGYVIVDPDPGTVWRDRATGGDSEQIYRVDLRVCASDYVTLMNSLGIVRRHMRGWAPWPDLRYTPIFEEDSGPVIADNSVPNDIRYSITLTYRVDA